MKHEILEKLKKHPDFQNRTLESRKKLAKEFNVSLQTIKRQQDKKPDTKRPGRQEIINGQQKKELYEYLKNKNKAKFKNKLTDCHYFESLAKTIRNWIHRISRLDKKKKLESYQLSDKYVYHLKKYFKSMYKNEFELDNSFEYSKKSSKTNNNLSLNKSIIGKKKRDNQNKTNVKSLNKSINMKKKRDNQHQNNTKSLNNSINMKKKRDNQHKNNTKSFNKPIKVKKKIDKQHKNNTKSLNKSINVKKRDNQHKNNTKSINNSIYVKKKRDNQHKNNNEHEIFESKNQYSNNIEKSAQTSYPNNNQYLNNSINVLQNQQFDDQNSMISYEPCYQSNITLEELQDRCLDFQFNSFENNKPDNQDLSHFQSSNQTFDQKNNQLIDSIQMNYSQQSYYLKDNSIILPQLFSQQEKIQISEDLWYQQYDLQYQLPDEPGYQEIIQPFFKQFQEHYPLQERINDSLY